MTKDRFDQPISTVSTKAAALNDEAIARLFALQLGSDALIDEALALDPDFALGHCTKARTLLQNGETAAAKGSAIRGRDLAVSLPERERRHAEIVCQVVHGETTAALAAIRRHAETYPRDAVPLSFALGVYGLLGFGGYDDFHAQQVTLLESVAPAWGADWWFLASLGWAYVEVGRCAEGIALLDRALSLHPDNANAIHGRAHGYYEQGAARDGEAFIAAWLPRYDRRAVLHGHLAWHQALFALQQGDVERAASIYADAVCPQAAAALPMFTLIDCANFAVRTRLFGRPLTKEQRRSLAAFAAERFPNAGVPFVNIHLAMAQLDDREALADLGAKVQELLADGRQACGPVVAEICSAIAAFGEGRTGEAAALLDTAMPAIERLGGSHAQRDVLVDLHIASHLGAGDVDTARALAEARSTRRASHLDQAWFARVAARLGGVVPR